MGTRRDYNYNNNYFTKMTVNEVGTVNPTPSEPVTLDQAKNWLRLDNNTDDDARISSLITTARRRAERYINKDIIAKNREVFWTVIDEDVNLPYTVDTISTITVDGETTTDYELLGSGNAILRLYQLPADKVDVAYATTDYINSEIQNGILMLVEEMYYNIKTQWKLVLSPFRVFAHYGVK